MDEKGPGTTEVVTTPACAYCDSTDTELISLFGQSLLGSQYYCCNCHSVFEAVRWTEEAIGKKHKKDA